MKDSDADPEALRPRRQPRRGRRRGALWWPVSVLAFAGCVGVLVPRLFPEHERARRLAAESTVVEAPPEYSASLVEYVLSLLGASRADLKTCSSDYDTGFAVAIHLALTLYTFLGLAIVCDEYFCESLEQISSALQLSDDVAGATFMAAGSSAPELFTALITIFVAPGEQGIGTIVGSAVFNICVIVGITALAAGQVLQLWWYPLTRDSSFYALSIVLMVLAMRDGQISVFESAGLVSTYLPYVPPRMGMASSSAPPPIWQVSTYLLYVVWMACNSRFVECITARERQSNLARASTGIELTVSIPYHTIPCHAIPYHAIPYHTIPYHIITKHSIASSSTGIELTVRPCRYAMLCHAMLCHAMLC